MNANAITDTKRLDWIAASAATVIFKEHTVQVQVHGGGRCTAFISAPMDTPATPNSPAFIKGERVQDPAAALRQAIDSMMKHGKS